MTHRPTEMKPPPPSPIPDMGMWPKARRPSRALLPQVLELFTIIAFLVISYYLIAWIWVRTAPREVKVPAIVGLQQREVVTLLEAAGLRANIVAETPSEKVRQGAVISAEPAPGRSVKVGRIVRLTVSSGSRWARVPDVSDMSVDRARALLREAKLVVRRERARYSKSVPVGYVLAQQPPAGRRVPRGTEVELLVSKGARPRTEVPEEKPVAEGPRSTDIELAVPPGASLQEVRIIVIDREGERVAYREYHEPGETVKQTVTGEGPKVTVRVYLSGLLVQEKDI